MLANEVDALLVVSFGSPESSEEVLPFLRRVTSGRGVPEGRLNTVAAQYSELGGVSPLNRENRELLDRLRRIAPSHWRGDKVYLGNRNSEPFVSGTLARMAGHGIRRVGVFITSAFSSYSGCRQYREDLAAGLQTSGTTMEFVLLPRFHDHRLLSDIWASRIQDVWPGDRARLILVTHSLPVAGSGKYVSEHMDLAQSVVQKLNRSGIDPEWALAFQSRSGSPAQPWLGPDINESIRVLGDVKPDVKVAVSDQRRGVVVAPIGFCAENMEVLWDLDQVAASTALELKLEYVRARLPQSDQRFVEMISDQWSQQSVPSCAADCCPNPYGPKPVVGDRPLRE